MAEVVLMRKETSQGCSEVWTCVVLWEPASDGCGDQLSWWQWTGPEMERGWPTSSNADGSDGLKRRGEGGVSRPRDGRVFSEIQIRLISRL